VARSKRWPVSSGCCCPGSLPPTPTTSECLGASEPPPGGATAGPPDEAEPWCREALVQGFGHARAVVWPPDRHRLESRLVQAGVFLGLVPWSGRRVDGAGKLATHDRCAGPARRSDEEVDPQPRRRRRCAESEKVQQTLAKERIERDDEDLVRLYLTDIGQYPCSQGRRGSSGSGHRRRSRGRGRTAQAPRARHLQAARAAAGRDPRGAGPADLRPSPTPPGRLDRQEVPGSGLPLLDLIQEGNSGS